MKKIYSSPQLEVALMNVADVIMLSGDSYLEDTFTRDDTIGEVRYDD